MKPAILSLCIITLLFGCKTDPGSQSSTAEEPKEVVKVNIPSSNQDSLYAFVEKQLSFGHRIPGTEAHKACKDWLVSTLESYGAEVIVQNFKANFQDVLGADAFNIIAQYNPQHKKRVIIGAHWDSRIIAEKESDESLKDKPILGADDGGSGVAGILEIARLLKDNPIDLGVDLILFDAEDQGDSASNLTWALGAQHWSKNMHKKGYKAKFGILLDMIGSKGATFGREYYSNRYAKNVLDKYWLLAKRMGHGNIFTDNPIPYIDDDHKYVNEIAKIPMIDVINWDFNANKFGHYHHTHKDDLSVIDKKILRAVTQITVAAIYKESGNDFL